MTNQGWFWLIASVFLVLLTLLAVQAWLKKPYKQSANTQLLAESIALFEQRLAELAADFANKEIEKPAYTQQKTLLERQLLAASDDLAHSQNQAKVGVRSLLAVCVAVPLFSILAYFFLADRSPVFTLWQTEAAHEQLADELLTGKRSTLPADFFVTEQPEQQSQRITQLLHTMQYQVYRQAKKPHYWQNLAAFYSTLAMPEQSLVGLARAYYAAPKNSSIAMHYAQQRFFADGKLTQESTGVLQAVLAQQPAHEGAYMLLIMNELKAQNYQQAKRWVTKLKQILHTKGTGRQTALASLEELTEVIDEKLSLKK